MAYIKEIQGLRTVAAMLVAVYHIWFNRVSGGVDVFFVVAAFFMTRTLLKIGESKIKGNHNRRIRDYYAQTFRRVVPSAAVVIFLTMIACAVVLARADEVGLWKDAVASSLFVENWWLAIEQSEYLEMETLRSPFQQFWALALQMQFYILWPLVAAVAIWVAKVRDFDLRRTMLAAFALIAVASFGYAVWLLGVDQPLAYFSTIARAWEFAAGALLALILHKVRPTGGAWWKLVGWGALVVLLTFAAVLDVSTMFPGPAALVPVGAAALLITSAIKTSQPAVLRWKPIIWLAPMSFAFYLWHWPLLILWQYKTNSIQVSWIAGLAIIALAWVLAWITTRCAEDPIRRAGKLEASIPLTIATCIALMVPAWAGAAYWRANLSNVAFQAVEIAEDVQDLEQCMQQKQIAGVVSCTVGDTSAKDSLVIVGSSHARQWKEPLNTLGKKHKFKVIVMAKAGCHFALAPEGSSEYDDPTCELWQRAATDEIVKLNPNLVFTMATLTSKHEGESIPAGTTEAFDVLAQNDIPVVAIRDNPRFRMNVPRCIEENPGNTAVCDRPYAEIYSDDINLKDLDNPHLTTLDYSLDYCKFDVCQTQYNGELMYRDSHHFKSAYLNTELIKLMERDLVPMIKDSR